MSDIVNKALTELLTGQHQMTAGFKALSEQSSAQADRIQAVIDAMKVQADNSVDVRQDIADLKARLETVESKVL